MELKIDKKKTNLGGENWISYCLNIFVQEPDWKHEAKKQWCHYAENREHITLYYLNGKDGLYKDFPD